MNTQTRGRPLSVGQALAVIGLCLMLLWLSLAVARAHAALESTSPGDGEILPQSPPMIALTFNEPIQATENGLRLIDASGTAIPLDGTRIDHTIQASVPQPLANGSYVVAWRVISADGHPISGAYTFAVGAASANPGDIAIPAQAADPTVDTLLNIAQGLAYAGLLAATGLAIFHALLWPAAQATPGLSRWQSSAALVAALSALLVVPLTVVRQQGLALATLGDPAHWFPLVSPDALATCGGTLIGLGIVTLLAPRLLASAQRVALLAGALLALASLVVTGHTRAFPPPLLIATADLVHVVVGAFWFGGLLGLTLVVRQILRASPVPRDAPAALCVARVIARFSGFMGVFIALLGMTGIILGWLILGSLEALLHTGYGRVLIIKVAVVVVAVLIGGWNRFRLVPAVTAQPNPGSPWRRLQSAMTAEAVLIVAVLLTTGVLVNQNPVLAESGSISAPIPSLPATPAPDAREIMIMGDLGDVSLHGTLTPGTAGQNTLTFSLHDHHDMPVETVANPTVSLSLPAHDLGPLQSEAGPTDEPGTYQAQVNVPLSGEWKLTISARISRFEEPSTTLEVTIP